MEDAQLCYSRPTPPVKTQDVLKGTHTHGRLSQGVLCVLYPRKGLTPVMLIVMAISPQEMLHVPIKSFHLAVTLGMVPGYKSDVYIEQTTEGLPYLGDELQSSV